MTLLALLTVVSLANLHKRPEALARYYVTSYWQAEWVKKLRWKAIELPPPPHPRRAGPTLLGGGGEFVVHNI